MQARALATRNRILDAAVETLQECGYAGTTTQEVQRRAGVSRGTLQYHFPTRPELLIGALEHVLSSVVREFMEARAADPVPPDRLIELMWEQWQGPALTAWLELAVAARTNAELQEPMRRVMEAFDVLIVSAFRELVGPDALPEEMRQGAPFFVFAVLNGLAVGRSYEHPGNDAEVLALLKILVTRFLPEASS